MSTVTAAAPKAQIGQIVFLHKVEECWDKPYVMKRHHVYDIKSVILKGRVDDVRGNEFKATLFDNNGFEKDGEQFVFNMKELLYEQNFTETELLGVWKYDKAKRLNGI